MLRFGLVLGRFVCLLVLAVVELIAIYTFVDCWYLACLTVSIIIWFAGFLLFCCLLLVNVFGLFVSDLLVLVV